MVRRDWKEEMAREAEGWPMPGSKVVQEEPLSSERATLQRTASEGPGGTREVNWRSREGEARETRVDRAVGSSAGPGRDGGAAMPKSIAQAEGQGRGGERAKEEGEGGRERKRRGTRTYSKDRTNPAKGPFRPV